LACIPQAKNCNKCPHSTLLHLIDETSEDNFLKNLTIASLLSLLIASGVILLSYGLTMYSPCGSYQNLQLVHLVVPSSPLCILYELDVSNNIYYSRPNTSWITHLDVLKSSYTRWVSIVASCWRGFSGIAASWITFSVPISA
jgi:hypothetical protein